MIWGQIWGQIWGPFIEVKTCLMREREGRLEGYEHNALVSSKLRVRELRGSSGVCEERRWACCRLPMLSCQQR